MAKTLEWLDMGKKLLSTMQKKKMAKDIPRTETDGNSENTLRETASTYLQDFR